MQRRQSLRLAAAGLIGPGLGLFDAPARAADDLAALWSAKLSRPQGGELPLNGLNGKALVVNFWATWCAPCVKELPLLDQFAKAQAARVRVVGIAVDRAEAVQNFLRKTPVGFEIGVAGFGGVNLARELGNPQGGLPFTVVIHPNGQVLARKLGETHAEDLAAWARQLRG
jgi:thiol-disulfide isomerase/thioredoxin